MNVSEQLLWCTFILVTGWSVTGFLLWACKKRDPIDYDAGVNIDDGTKRAEERE